MKPLTMLAIASAFMTAPGAAAPDAVEFQRGLWEFARTVNTETGHPLTVTNQKCTSPSDDMRATRDAATKAGCTVSPTTTDGSTRTYTYTCTFAGQPVESTSVLTVESARAYSVAINSKGGGKSTQEKLVAKRVGDC